MRHWVWLIVLLLLSGCSTIGGWFGDDDNPDLNEPSELLSLSNEVDIDSVWSASPGDGSDDQFLRLELGVSEGKLFSADHEGLVAALDAETGRRLWEVETDKRISAGAGVGPDSVYVATRDAEVIALNASTGETLWTQTVSSEVLSIPKYDAGLVVVRSVDGRLTGLDATDGQVRWTYTRDVPALSLRGTSSPVIKQGGVITGYASGKLVVLRLNDGRQIWEASVAIPRGRSELERMVDIDADPLVTEEAIFVSTYQGGLVALALRSGQIIWRRGELDSVSGLATDWRAVMTTDTSGNVWAVDQRDGRVIWGQSSLKYRGLSAPAVLGDYVIVGDFEGYVHILSATDGHLMGRARVGSDPIVSAPVVVGDLVYVYDTDGEIAAFRIGSDAR